MHQVSANGISINYRIDERKDGDKDAPVVVLSNSLLSSYPMWDDQIDALTDDFRVLRYDTRGHGGTDAPADPYSIEIFVGDVVSLLDILEISKVNFIGLSMGGFIGQLFAATYPERAISLTLCDTACIMPPPELWNDRIETAQTEGVAGLIEGTLQRWFTAPFHETGKDDIARIVEMIKATGPQGYVNCARAIRDMDQRDILKDIKTSTQIIVGADDPACPVSAANVLHDGIAGSRLHIIPDAAHLPNIEKKEEFNQVMMAFLKGQNA